MLNKMQKKQLKKQLENLINKNICVTINKFLKLYCGVNDENFTNKQFTHRDLLVLFPSIKKVSLTKVLDSINSFYTGKFIIVIDSNGDIMSYVTPELKDDYDIEENSISIDIYIKKDFKAQNIVLDENLSRFELAILCRYYKEHQQYSKYRAARELLKIKKDEQTVEKYKNKKLELRMKGREVDD